MYALCMPISCLFTSRMKFGVRKLILKEKLISILAFIINITLFSNY